MFSSNLKKINKWLKNSSANLFVSRTLLKCLNGDSVKTQDHF